MAMECEVKNYLTIFKYLQFWNCTGFGVHLQKESNR